MEVRPNLFQKAAFLYDYDDRDIVKDDIPFYLEYAAKYPGDILELACGTGRVAIALAQNSYQVYGIDLSGSMLEQFRIKLAGQPKAVQDRIWIGQYNMADFQLNKEFSLIIVPFRGFQVLTTKEAQRNCLKCVYEHLSDEGVFIVDTFRPYKKLDETWVYPETVQWETTDKKTGRRIVKKHRGPKIDVINQIIYPEMIYQIVEPGGRVMEIREPLELKYYYYDQLKELLESSGLKIKEEFGYYDKSSIENGKELIFVCSK